MRCGGSCRRRWPAILEFRGWICQETLCDRSSVTFDLTACRRNSTLKLTIPPHASRWNGAPGGFYYFANLTMTSPQSSSQPPVPEASVQSQIDALWQRGMAIPHRGEASRFLTHVGSYRLRGYWQPFEDRSQDGDPPSFRTGTNFAAVMERYHFDRELRVLLLDAFAHIEVSIRSVWALELSETADGGPDRT